MAHSESSNCDVRVRFAPSPTGRLHLGHAYSALLNDHVARAAGGRMLLRIEDIDRVRARPEFTEAIFEDLAWLDVSWQRPPLHQSKRFAAYRQGTETLTGLGLLYPCFATRGDLLTAAAAQSGPTRRDPDGAPLYPGLWRNADPDDVRDRMEAGVPYALRLNIEAALALDRKRADAPDITFEECGVGGVPEQTAHAFAAEFLANKGVTTSTRTTGELPKARTIHCDPARWGDIVVVRKDTPASYHLAVVIDDAAQQISMVVRGMDLFAATDVQRLLQRLLGLRPPAYCHHPLIRSDDGAKLSKSENHPSIADLRADGLTPQAVRQQLFGGLDVAERPRSGI